MIKRQLIEQMWKVGDLNVTFELLGEEEVQIHFVRGEDGFTLKGGEAKVVKDIFENTNYIFKADNINPNIPF